MFQKGTGERFKYKEAVKKMQPDAQCTKSIYTVSSSRLVVYQVSCKSKVLSSLKKSAEDAWADAYGKFTSSQND